MQSLQTSIGDGPLLKRKKLLGVTMGLLCLDPSAVFAHGGAFAPVTTPTLPLHNTSASGPHSLFTSYALGKSHSTLPLVPIVPGASKFHSLMPTGHKSVNLGISPTSVTARTNALSTEVGQVGQTLSLDLTSTSTTIMLGANLFGSSQSVTIEVGGVKETFRAGGIVTSAEYVAIQQVLTGRPQAITLNSVGAAIGGSFSLNAVDKSNVTSLVVPSGVTAIESVNKNANILVNGDINNYGSIEAISTSTKLVSGIISAVDITNEQGGSINAGSTSHPVDLSLVALNNITNAGSLTSSGALTLTAGSNIVNALSQGASAPAVASAATASIHAMSNVNLSVGSGNVTNGGSIISVNNNINITAPSAATSLNINGAGGSFQAKQGDINVRDASYSGAGNLTLTGGDYLSNNLNLYSGTGTISGNIGNVTGILHNFADAEHLIASTDNLQIGSSCIKGDPTFFNINSGGTGNITMSGTISTLNECTVIATGDIDVAAGTAISASAPTGSGADVTLIAGANITSPSTGGQNAIPPTSPPGVAVTFAGASTTGGQILFTGSGSSIDTSGYSNNGSGGDVNLFAFGGSSASSGTINLNGASIVTSGIGTGSGGNVTVVGGANNNPVSLGTIITTGGGSGGSGGSVAITTANPTNTSTTYASGGFVSSGGITAGAVITGAQVNIAGAINTSGSDAVTGGATGGAAGSISVTAGGNIIASTGANLTAIGGRGAAGTDGVTAGAAGAAGGQGGAGGQISISSATGSITLQNSDTSGGAGGAGGAGLAGIDGSGSKSGHAAGQPGGNGGIAGSGGAANSISLSATQGNILINGSITAIGGAGASGGAGGAGGAGSDGVATSGGGVGDNGGAGGAAASGGNGGSSNTISISAGQGNITINGPINSIGGAGGSGGQGGGGGFGGNGTQPTSVGGTGGAGGNGGAAGSSGNGGSGGNAAAISIVATQGLISSTSSVQSAGGNAGSAGQSGNSGGGGNGGLGNAAAAAANATTQALGGGTGGAGGAAGANTSSANGGAGGSAQNISIVASQGGISIAGSVQSIGGSGGNGSQGGSVGSGGNGGVGGAGGAAADNSALAGGAGGSGGAGGAGSNGQSGGNAGIGGAAGSVTITATENAINIGGNVSAVGGQSGAGGPGSGGGLAGAGGPGGTGGAGSNNIAGNGSDGGPGGSGGSGGSGGAGGNGGNAAASGHGGVINVNAGGGTLTVSGNFDSSGGAVLSAGALGAGAFGGDAAPGGMGGVGGTGGGGGTSGNQGANGSSGTNGSTGTAGLAGKTANFGQPAAITIGGDLAINIDGYIKATADPNNLSTITTSSAEITLRPNQGSLAIFGAPLTIAGTNYSIYGGSGIVIEEADGVGFGTAQYSANGDLTVNTQTITVNLAGTPFNAVSSAIASGSNGTQFGLASETGHAITINNIAASNPLITGPTAFQPLLSGITITQSDSSTLTLTSAATPAQFIAVIQTLTTGQTISVSPFGGTTGGVANGGTFTLATQNLPTGGFTAINLPTGVTENVTTTAAVLSSANIVINGTLNFTGSSGSLSATSANGGISGAGLITSAGPLTLTAGTGGIGGVSQLHVNATTLQANATGGTVNILEGTSNATVSGTANTFSVTGGMYFGPIMAQNINLVSTAGGDINIVGVLQGVTPGTNATSVTINADTVGSIFDNIGTQYVPAILTNLLTLSSGSGQIGTSTNSVTTNASTLSANTAIAVAPSQGVYIYDTNTGTTTLNASNSGSVFQLTTAENLTVAQPLSANQIILNASYTGNLTIASSVTANTGNVTLTSGPGNVDTTAGTISTGNTGVTTITTGAGNIALGNINSGTLNLVTNSGLISQAATTAITGTTLNLNLYEGSAGTLATPIAANVTSITSDAVSVTSGTVYLTDNSTGTINLGNNKVGVFSLIATGTGVNVDVNSVNSINSHNITLSAQAGTITLTGNALTGDQDAAGNGGSISLIAKSIVGSSNTTDAVISAPGKQVSGVSGGSINLNITDPTSTTEIGVGAGGLSLVATGGNGGSVTVVTSGALSLDTNVSGGLTGISIAPQVTNGNGGTVALSANNYTWSTINSTALNINADGNGSGNGGTASVVLTGTQMNAATIGNVAGAFNLSAGSGTGGSGGNVIFSTPGNLNIVTDASGNAMGAVTSGLNVAGDPATGNGGSVLLTANQFNWGVGSLLNPFPNSTALILNVNGGTTSGHGGFLSVDQTGPGNAQIGVGAGQFDLNASGGNNALLVHSNFNGTVVGSGVAFAANGSVIVNPSGINVAATTTDADGETIIVQSASATTFNIGLATSKNLNGYLGNPVTQVAGQGSGKGGSLTFINTLGSVTNTVALTTGLSNLTLEAGGTKGVITLGQNIGAPDGSTNITMATLGAGSITTSKTIIADTLSLSSAGGSIGALTVTATDVNANAPSGSISITDKAAGLVTLGTVTGATAINTALTKGFSFTDTLGNIAVGSVSDNVNILAGTSLIIKGSATTSNNGNVDIFGNLNASGTNGAVTITAGGTTVKGGIGGNITAHSGDISAAKTVTLTASKGLIVVNAIGAVKAPVTASLSALLSVQNNLAVNATTTITEKASSTASGQGNIIVDGNIETTSAVANTGAVTLTAGGSATSAAGITVNGAFDIGGGKSVTLAAAHGSVVVNTIGAGGVLGKTPGTVTISALTNITDNGNINAATSVTEKTTASNVNSLIDVIGDITVSSTAGAITLTNAGAAAVGSGIIAVGTLSAHKTITLTASKGNIQLNSILGTAAVKATALNSITDAGTIDGASIVLSQTLKSTVLGTGITINNAASSNGLFSAIGAGNLVQVQPGGVVTTAGTTNKTDTITIEDSNITSGNVTIGASAQINTDAPTGGKGNVAIVVGTIPTAVASAPTSPGTIVYTTPPATKPVNYAIGTTGVALNAGGPTFITFNAIGTGQVIVSNKGTGGSLVTIDGGATSGTATRITADPPALSSVVLQPTGQTAAACRTEANNQSNILPTVSLSGAPPNTIGQSTAGGALGAIQSSIVEGNSNPVSALTRTLYGAASEFAIPQESVLLSTESNNSEIEAAIIGGSGMGTAELQGPLGIEMTGWTGPQTKAFSLRRGNVIVAPDRDTVVETSFGQVEVGAHSVVLVMALPSGTAVYNLDDKSKNSVVLRIGKSEISLAPGRHAMLTSHLVESFEMVNPAEVFGYRNVTSKRVDKNLQAFTAEFSTVNAIGQIKQLRALINSDHLQANRVASHMLKTAAIMQQIGGGGQYQQYQHPRMTASAEMR